MPGALRLSLYEHPAGVAARPGERVVYDLAGDRAHFGAAAVDGPAIVWELEGDGSPLAAGAVLSERLVPLPGPLILRCDRIDFPPGGVAYLHTHPGPGIRRLLFGSIRIESDGHVADYGPAGCWFEPGPAPVRAVASATEDTAFVRVMGLPAAWKGKRAIACVDPEDEAKPKMQRAHVYCDKEIAL